MSEVLRFDWKNFVFRVSLLAVMAVFFANLFVHWFDQTYASVVLLVVFFGGLAVYRRIWVRAEKKTVDVAGQPRTES